MTDSAKALTSAFASLRTRLSALVADIGRSCYDVARYRTFRAKPLRDAIRYFAAFTGLIAAAVFVAATIAALPIPGRVVTGLRDALPEDAAFIIVDGQLSMEGIDLPVALGTGTFPVIIDTSIEGMPERLDGGIEDGIVLGRDAAFVVEEGRTVTARSFASLADGRMTVGEIVGRLDRSGPVFALAAGLAFALLHTFTVATSAIALTLAASLLAFGVAHLWGAAMTYRQLLAVGLHAVTLPVLADHLLWGLGARTTLAFPVLYFMVIIAVIVDERQSPVGAPTVDSPDGSHGDG